jgi:hypothetical protein
MEKSGRKNRLSPAFTGWVIGGLFVGMLVLLFWPAPKEAPAPPPPLIERPSSELTKVGLPDDPDLEGLPAFFAIWADYAEWKDGKTIFAYRHPVSGEFSFYFEATRTAEGYRFRPIPAPVEGGQLRLRDFGREVPVAFWSSVPAEEKRGPRAQDFRTRPTQEPPNSVQIDFGGMIPPDPPPPGLPERRK